MMNGSYSGQVQGQGNVLKNGGIGTNSSQQGIVSSNQMMYNNYNGSVG